LVWRAPVDSDSDVGYWEQFESLDEAASNHPTEEIFRARPRLLGKFRMERKPVRIRPRKRKK